MSGAAAQVARHGVINFSIRWVGVLLEQRGSRHDLPCLAVTALRYIEFLPRGLQGVSTLGIQTLDGDDLFATHGGYRCHASARRAVSYTHLTLPTNREV